MPSRRGMDAVPPRVKAELSQGIRETRVLVECFTIDFAVLLRHAVPGVSADAVARMEHSKDLAFTRRMRLAAELAIETLAETERMTLARHPSDTVRGWACYMAGLLDGWSLERRVRAVRALADDSHFGVREWAWLGIRDAIVAEPIETVALLRPWTEEASENLRRFATEATRPRGVWAKHICLFKEKPELGMPLLEPLRADASRYVQDSVANWLNDAAKTQGDWVRKICDRWRTESPQPTTERICRRAMRNL
jgi:3-methyladenine DNA glycosylase AlkC